MKLLFWLSLTISLATSLPANAEVFIENFNTTVQKDSSTLVWNFELGFLHPQLRISGYTNGVVPPAPVSLVSVGDGSHGSFDPTTYTNFGTVDGSGNIVIDATLFPILKVSRFQLGASYTLTSINGPLVIYSLSTVLIDGAILCSGENGTSATGVTGGVGGAGHCGGYNGGAGGNAGASGSDGIAGSSNFGGGGIFISAPGSAGGGGGGGYRNDTGGAGETFGANTGGASGSQLASVDLGFNIVDGSAGGGGGSGSDIEGGGGGGAGGGTVIIHAVDDVIISAPSGAIYARGGLGGGAIVSGGFGGSGAGGNVKIFTMGNYINDTIIDVNSSAPSLTPATSGDGGRGSRGRTWIRGDFSIFGAGTETETSSLTDPGGSEGNLNYVTGTVQTATSKSYDTQSSVVLYQSIIATPASANVSIEVASSDDDFVSDDTGWVNSAAISAVSEKRYLKFRISINNTNTINPTRVNDLTLTYDKGTQENFTFKTNGCGLVKNQPPKNLNWILLLLFIMPLLTALKLRKPKTVPVRVKR